jgi:ATP-binding cassette subfamily B protein
MSRNGVLITGFAVLLLGLAGIAIAEWATSPASLPGSISAFLTLAVLFIVPIAGMLVESGGSSRERQGSGRMGALAVLRFARRCWRPHLGGGLVLLVLLLVQQSYGITIAYAMKRLVDYALPQRDGDAVMIILAALGGAYVVTVIATVASEKVGAGISAAIMCELRGRMFAQLQRLSLGYHSRTHSGDVIARFSADLGDVEKGVTTRIIDGVLSLVGLLVYVPFLFFLDARLASVVVIGLPFVVIGGQRFSESASKARKEMRKNEAEVIEAVADNVRAQPVIKLFDLASHAIRTFGTKIDGLRENSVRSTFLAAMVGTVTSVGVLLFQGIVIAVGAILALDGSLATGTLVAFVTLHASVSKQAYDLAKKVVPALITSGGGIARIEELLDEPVEINDRQDAVALDPGPASFRLEHVSFEYEPGRPCISDVSLEISEGQNVAFVGPSGSGKSTVLKFLLRFHDPQKGRVLMRGHDVRDLSLASLHAHISAVFQDPLLIAGSISDNIRVGKLDATDSEIEEAARDARIHDTIVAMPEGYATPIGEAGGRLSGGQRQRLAIARALVRRPPVLVLDEATSALDPASESAIEETIASLALGRTVISVTHRLARATTADRIFVFDEGRLVEEGIHEALKDAGGVYGDLWRKQSGIEIAPQGTAARVEPEWLREIPLFRNAPENVLAHVASEFVFERLDGDRVVFEEGDEGDKFYILARGKVEVITQEGKRLAVLTDGDFFGEIALIDDVSRNATVRTIAASSFLTLTHAQFDKLLEKEEELRAAIRNIVDARLEAR